MKISVILCAHNPRAAYLQRVLDALKAQTLPVEQWELLLIDNASQDPLIAAWDLSWHPHARHIREEKLGLTPARLRGIGESAGDFLVFVDDDNILAADYLERVVLIFQQSPNLGAIGASIKGEFEIPPPDWITPYLGGLVVYELDRDYRSDTDHDIWQTKPFGAGLGIRRQVAEDYAQKAKSSELRRLLGRSGVGLGAGEDTDIVLCAEDLGMGAGRFVSLKLTHLIPKVRLTKDYIIRLHAGFAAANEILFALRQKGRRVRPPAWKEWFHFLINFWRTKGIAREILLATVKAQREARTLLATHHYSS